MLRKILIMGLPGSGKTTLAKTLAARLKAVHLNADEVRAHINKDLGFTESDRIEQAARMGWLCDRVTEASNFAIADFICPTEATRDAFTAGGKAFIIWVDRIKHGRFDDTNRLFTSPSRWDLRVTPLGTPDYWAEEAARRLLPVFDPKKPTALFVGRFQPFHDGHRTLVLEGMKRIGQACIAVRDTHCIDAHNPMNYEEVRSRIEMSLRGYAGRFTIVQVPNISAIFYGRNVGYAIERIELDSLMESISATDIRRKLASD